MRKGKVLVVCAVFLAVICSGAWAAGSREEVKEAAGPSGTVIFLTHRTDLVDNLFEDYKARFNEKYPNVTIEIEGITDYAGVVRTRMNTEEYGDVLMMITSPPIPEDFSRFYIPLGNEADLERTYTLLSGSSYDDVTYGIAPNANVSGGIVYNKRIFREAGYDLPPKTIDEFYSALRAIKTKFPDTAPIYMNYPSGWTLNQWEGNLLTIAGDPDYVNELAHIDDPFSPGRPHYILYKVMYDVVANRLCENDPLTSDWELSKQMLADGRIGCMVLGSWAIAQVRDLAENPDDIGYMPFPYAVGGKIYAEVSPDYRFAINVHSENKAAARAWLDWFLEESGFAVQTMSIPTKIGSEYPTVLNAFQELGVTYIESTPAPEGEEGLTDRIDKEAEIGRWNDPWKKLIVESALGSNSRSYDEIMADLNERWAEARRTVGEK